jgi:hypothetical protein
VLLLTAWTNVHASFPIAAPIGAGIAFDALRRSHWRNWRGWLYFGAASLIAIALNANGFAGLLYPFKVTNLAMLPLIQEWQPTTLARSPQFYLSVAAGLFALLLKGARVPPGRLVLLLVMLGLALAQMRHQSWFIVVAACLVPPLLAPTGAQMPAFKRLRLVALPLLALRGLIALAPPTDNANPLRLLAAIPESLRDQPVFNDYTFGGPLILAGIRPYIDGRSDMYGDPFVLDYVEIIEGDEERFNRAVAKYGIRWTMLPYRDKALISKLDSSPRWRRIYADKTGLIHVRVD